MGSNAHERSFVEQRDLYPNKEVLAMKNLIVTLVVGFILFVFAAIIIVPMLALAGISIDRTINAISSL